MNVSKNALRVLAAIVWLTGGCMLCMNALRLLIEAHSVNSHAIGIWISPVLGITIGLWRGKIMFRKSCKRNLDRIAALKSTHPFAFFRPFFFILLAIMIGAGATLSHFAHGHYIGLVVVSILDFAVGIGLLASSYLFWSYHPPANSTGDNAVA